MLRYDCARQSYSGNAVFRSLTGFDVSGWNGLPPEQLPLKMRRMDGVALEGMDNPLCRALYRGECLVRTTLYLDTVAGERIKVQAAVEPVLSAERTVDAISMMCIAADLCREPAVQEFQDLEIFRLLAENMRDVMWVVDEEGIIRYISPSIVWLTGHDPQVLTGASVECCLPATMSWP
jgi:PAS domain-containing protein